MPRDRSQAPLPRLNHPVAIGVVLAVYLAVVLGVTLWPAPVTEGANKDIIDRILTVSHDAGVPASFTFHTLQFVANVAMFVPLGLLAALLLPQRLIWLVLVGAPLLSAAIELTQLLGLTARQADVWDVVANSLGAWLGVAIALGILAMLRARARRAASRRPRSDARRPSGGKSDIT